MVAEEIPLGVIEGRVSAVVDNQDDTVTVTFLVEKISVGRTMRGVDGSEDLFMNIGLRPAGDMPIRVRLSSHEIAEKLDGLGRIGKEVIAVISDMQNLILFADSEELKGQMPPDEIAADWNAIRSF